MLSKMEAASQAPKKTLKLSTLVSSLLQVYPRRFSTAESGFNRRENFTLCLAHPN
jgi:hypothetical protein